MVELEESLYKRLGGEEFVGVLVEKMYSKILSDPTLNVYFYISDINFLKKHQKNFFSFILGGPRKYDGDDLREAHKHLHLKERDFDQFKTHIDNTLSELHIKSEISRELLAIVEFYRTDVLNK